MSNRILVWALGGLFVAVCAVAAYKLWPLINPTVTAVATGDPDCDLRAGACAGRLPGGAVIRFAIAPRDIPVVQPLRLRVEVEGIAARGVEVDFSGVDMNMGFNRPRLDQVGNGVFEGGGMLPVCVRAHMAWEAKVLVQTPDGLVAAPFRFDTYTGTGRPAVE